MKKRKEKKQREEGRNYNKFNPQFLVQFLCKETQQAKGIRKDVRMWQKNKYINN